MAKHKIVIDVMDRKSVTAALNQVEDICDSISELSGDGVSPDVIEAFLRFAEKEELEKISDISLRETVLTGFRFYSSLYVRLLRFGPVPMRRTWPESARWRRKTLT